LKLRVKPWAVAGLLVGQAWTTPALASPHWTDQPKGRALAAASLNWRALPPLPAFTKPASWQPVAFVAMKPAGEQALASPFWSQSLNAQPAAKPPLAWQRLAAADVVDPSGLPVNPQKPAPLSLAALQHNLSQLPNQPSDYSPLLKLGQFPTASLIGDAQLQLIIGQVSPFSTGQAGGTGLQNYSGDMVFGLTDSLQLSAFYTQTDDPLFARIPSREGQPENRWDSTGAALRWKVGQAGTVSFAIEGAVENFYVKSGGTNSVGSSGTSCNIFNSNCTTAVANNNLVGSISAPISWQASKHWQFSFTPGVTFLPASQGDSNGRGQFYGTNVFLGAGVAYRPISKLQFFGSALLPLGPGNNSFNSDLTYSKVPIFSGGLRYSLNPRIALEGSLTNGYGATPSTAVLALPSSNQILYAGRLIYTPTRPDAPAMKRTPADDRLSFGGLSVSNANLIAAGTSRLRASFDSRGNLSTRYDVGFSDEFSFDLEVGQLSTGSNPSSSFANTYMTPGNATVRGAGTALFFSQPRGDAISSALRISYGRVLGETRPGYNFVEWINTYQVSQVLSFNINPKVALSGSEAPYGLGLSANWQLNSWLSVIPEGNLATNGGQSNWTLAFRACPSGKLCFDLYGTSALSFQDAGQILTAADPGVGLSVGLKF